ncbi:hypothetical protein THIOM_002045, partial [Candidatus Thiomargarita nelsonii]
PSTASVAFEPIGTHWKSKMPLTLEFRIFFLHKKTIAIYPYWDKGKYPLPPLERFRKIAQRVDSHFFTMDVAKSQDFRFIQFYSMKGVGQIYLGRIILPTLAPSFVPDYGHFEHISNYSSLHMPV